MVQLKHSQWVTYTTAPMSLRVLLTGLMLTQGSATVGVMVAGVGLVIMTAAAALFLRHTRHR